MAWSAPAAAKGPITATGRVSCATPTGTVKFSPPVSMTGNSNNELVMLKLKLSGCTTSGSNLVAIKSGRLTLTLHVPTTSNNTANACRTLAAGGISSTTTVKWAAAKTKGMVYAPPVAKSVLSMTGEAWSPGGANVTASFPGTGVAANSGTSFAGTDGGASSSLSVVLALSGTQYGVVCTSGVGHISKSTVNSGSVTLG
jgi:hypothetical protein